MLVENFKPAVQKNFVFQGAEKNDGKYLVETAGYLPLKEQLNEMRRAGVNLLAYRMARADVINAVDKKTGKFLGFDDVEDYDDLTCSVENDEIDIMAMRRRYRDLMANQMFADVMKGKVPQNDTVATEQEKTSTSVEKTENPQ